MSCAASQSPSSRIPVSGAPARSTPAPLARRRSGPQQSLISISYRPLCERSSLSLAGPPAWVNSYPGPCNSKRLAGHCTFRGVWMKHAASLPRLILCLGIVAGLSMLAAVAHGQRPPEPLLGSGPFTYHTLVADFSGDVITKGLVHP